jgi:cardiolipin synthase
MRFNFHRRSIRDDAPERFRPGSAMLDWWQDAWQSVSAIPHLGLYLTLGWLGYLVGLGLWIVLQKREPVATVSWLISLAALPYLGFLIYYVFGPQRIRASVAAGLRVPRRCHGFPQPEAIELAKIAQATTGLPPTTATDARLLIDGAAKYAALLEAVAQAREHIHLEYYIYQPDRTGTALRDALVERASAGVPVRLLLDAVGSGKATDHFLKPLLDAGREVAGSIQMRLHWFWKRPWLNLRTHRKIVVIDGRIGFTGGINITDEEDERLRPDDAYRDLHLRLEGDVVRVLQLVFVEDWAYATGEPPLQLPHPPPPAVGVIPAQVLVSGPTLPGTHSPIHAVRSMPRAGGYGWSRPTSSPRGGDDGADLGRWRVDVRLLARFATALVTYAARRTDDRSPRRQDPRVRPAQTRKALRRRRLAIIGSANFDHRSFRLNFEVSVMSAMLARRRARRADPARVQPAPARA